MNCLFANRVGNFNEAGRQGDNSSFFSEGCVKEMRHSVKSAIVVSPQIVLISAQRQEIQKATKESTDGTQPVAVPLEWDG